MNKADGNRYIAGRLIERSRESLELCLKFISDSEEFRMWNSITTPEWFVQAALLEMELEIIIDKQEKTNDRSDE